MDFSLFGFAIAIPNQRRQSIDKKYWALGMHRQSSRHPHPVD
jgi:hypothetical protein